MQTISKEELKAILKEYEYNPDIMCDEDPKVSWIKYRLTKIPEVDKIIFCIYLDCGSSRKCGKILGVSHSTILKEINKIKKEIMNV